MMKTMVLRNWMMAAFFVGATFSLVACDDDDNETPPPAGPDATVVVGSYSGTMQLVEAQPKEGGEGEEPAGTELEAAVTKDAVEFENFPIRSLIAAVLGESGTDEVIDGIIEAVGPVGYTMPYTATINEDKTIVRMALEPEVLNITMGDPETDGLTIAVTISADSDAVYNLESKTLQFPLSVYRARNTVDVHMLKCEDHIQFLTLRICKQSCNLRCGARRLTYRHTVIF